MTAAALSHTARVRRLSIALAVAFAWLALPAAASAQTALTPDEFSRIDAVYAAFGAFDDADGSTAADRSAARSACTALGSATAMLSGLRRMCSAQLRVGLALGATERCKGRTACLLGVRRVRRALRDLLVYARASNRTVVAAGLSAGCERELRVDMRTLRYYTALLSAFGLSERALRIGSVRLAERAERRISALPAPDTRSSAQQRADYRAACAAPA